MARTVNYPKRAEKIKEMIDDLVKEMGHSPHTECLKKTKSNSLTLTLKISTL